MKKYIGMIYILKLVYFLFVSRSGRSTAARPSGLPSPVLCSPLLSYTRPTPDSLHPPPRTLSSGFVVFFLFWDGRREIWWCSEAGGQCKAWKKFKTFFLYNIRKRIVSHLSYGLLLRCRIPPRIFCFG